jgi:hypothetical protein
MASLLTQMAIGGAVGAAGAVISGLMLVALRTFLNRNRRIRELEKIRQLGILATIKLALFNEPNPEFRFPRHRAAN